MAALFLRKVILIYWDSIDIQNQNQCIRICHSFYLLVKQFILDKMQQEPEELVRRAICGVVSVLAAQLLKKGQWKEILDRMNTVLFMI